MENKYLEKIAGMQSAFFKPKTTSGLAPKFVTPDTTRTIKPIKSVMTTNARELTKAAGIGSRIASGVENQAVNQAKQTLASQTNPASKGIIGSAGSMLGSGIMNTGRVVSGTGTLLARTGAVLSGKVRNEAAYLHAAKLNPHMTDTQINEFVGQSDDVIRKHMLKHNPSAIENFNSHVNARKAARTIAVGGLATAAAAKYQHDRQMESEGLYSQY